jgi:ribosomal protein S18 acetylase RimI-like enzyme
VAVVDRWRDHLDVLAVEALWCAQRDVGEAMLELVGVAGDLGMHDVLTPLVPLEDAHTFEAAGMHICEHISNWLVRLPITAAGTQHRRPGIRIRAGSPEDLRAVHDLDRACFDEFWRYDRRHLERFLTFQRLGVAEGESGPIGYTLTTVGRGDAQLGRVCVAEEWRRQGVAGALVADAAEYARYAGASRLLLCTQTGNVPARTLYRGLGFRETPGHSVLLRFG